MNSSLLNTLLKRAQTYESIASRTWSIFWGWVGVEKEHQMNGSLVLGGYDRAKVKGGNLPQKLMYSQDRRTSLVIYVTDIIMGFPDGNLTNIYGGSGDTALPMCILPDLKWIQLPDGIWNNFRANVGGTYLSYSRSVLSSGEPSLYLAENVYAGNISFRLSSGLQITIPNHQLIIPDRTVDQRGQIVFNDSTREIMVCKKANNSGMPHLGSAFLTSAYMMIDYDEGEFTLWEANATTNEDLVAVDHLDTACVPSPAPSPRFSGGSIGGIVIGSVAFAGIIACVIWFLIRRKRRRQDKTADEQKPYAKAELESNNQPRSPQELDSEELLPKELSGNETALGQTNI